MRPCGIGELGDDLEQRGEARVVADVDLVAEAGQPLAGRQPAHDDLGRPAGALALHEHVVRLRRRAAVVDALDGGQPGGEREVRARPRRPGDADGERRRRQLVVGEQHERPVEDPRQLRRRVRVPGRGEAGGDGAGRRDVLRRPRSQHDRGDAEQPPGGRRRVVGAVPGAEPAGDGDQRADVVDADGRGDLRGQLRRRAASGSGHVASPAGSSPVHSSSATCSNVAVRASSATSRPKYVTPASSSTVMAVAICTSSDGRGVDSRWRTRPASDSTSSTAYSDVRPSTATRPADQAAADVGVQRGPLDPEQAGRLAGPDVARHGDHRTASRGLRQR